MTELRLPQSSSLDFFETAEEAVDRLIDIYDEQTALIERRFLAYADGQDLPKEQHAVYPYLAVEIPVEQVRSTSMISIGRITGPTYHGTSITRPRLFRDYLIEQLTRAQEKLSCRFYVGLSDTPIPLTFALEAASAALTPKQKQNLQYQFHLPNLAATNDDIVDGRIILRRTGVLPLSLFTAERVDYSLHRIQHYTATPPEEFQPYILFTNYQRYVNEFIEYALEEVRAGRADYLVEPGGRITAADGVPSAPELAKQPQMPAYHLVRKDKTGITLVNIGVGPSNAKTITDHLAVLRPHVWVMIGHCGALRRTQRLGDYVLAHAYLRDDKVLDDVLPTSIPLPTIAEVQVALTQAVVEVTNVDPKTLKQHLRTGTVVTTADRNWEIDFQQNATRLNLARAIAIDMESATVAANGYRYRVPYGTLLCASDRPLHGEIKLPGMADAFYEERVSQHFEIGVKTIDLLREEAQKGNLHSRKLRSFDEPLLR